LHIDCWYETGVDGDTELMECFIITGKNYELKENGPWYNEILSAVEAEIKSKIYDWQTKQFEADREQGGGFEMQEDVNKKIILHLCADIGSDSKPYQDNPEYEVITIGKDIGVENYTPPPNVYGIIANPVCTEFSIAQGFHRTGDYEKGMVLVNACLRIIKICKPKLKFWMMENPATGRLKDFLGKPQFTYEPWHFGDPWTKKTALWGKFNIPERLYTNWEDVPKNDKLYIRPGRPKPSMAFLHKSAIKNIPAFSAFTVDDDMSFRSLCPQGWANAFFKVNR
jgi:hypothetical protein